MTVAIQGDFGKPRPALVIQSDLFNETHATVSVLLISNEIIHAPLFRITIHPTLENGLDKVCQIQVDKTMTIRHEKIGSTFGKVNNDILLAINHALTVFLGLA